MTAIDINAWGEQEMNDLLHDHSRWGAGDQVGAGNLLTQERRLSALRSICNLPADNHREVSKTSHNTSVRARH